jgi:hypothetical protein
MKKKIYPTDEQLEQASEICCLEQISYQKAIERIINKQTTLNKYGVE